MDDISTNYLECHREGDVGVDLTNNILFLPCVLVWFVFSFQSVSANKLVSRRKHI
jgi:hypothetical protein